MTKRHTTTGLDAHIQELKPLFTFAPDTKIKEHPVRFGTADAEWTAVIGTRDNAAFMKQIGLGQWVRRRRGDPRRRVGSAWRHPRLAGFAVDVSQSDLGGREVHRAEDDR